MITYTFLLVLNCTESNAAKTSSEGLEIKKTIFFGGGGLDVDYVKKDGNGDLSWTEA